MEAAFARIETVDVSNSVPVIAHRAPAKTVAAVWATKPVPAEEIPAGIMAIAALLYAVMFAAFGAGFSGGSVIWAIAGFAVVAFALVREFGGGIGDFMNGTMATATGPISGRAAVALVLTVPACLAAGTIVIATAFRLMQ